MHEIDIGRLNLNLLKVFVAVMEEGSVTAAGFRLGLAQSSVSHSLGRLRTAFGDQLFVPSTTGMQPTPYALNLFEPVSNALVSVQTALDEVAGFNPKTSTRVFSLVMTDVCELMFMPRLLSFSRIEAPSVTIKVRQLPRNDYRDALESGVVDIALGQLPQGHQAFFQQHLFCEEFACVMRADHPLSKNLSLSGFLEAEHLSIGSPAISEDLIRKALGERAARRKIRLYLPHYMVAPFVLSETDLIAVLPHTVAKAYGRLENIIELPLPFKIQPVVTRQFWHKRTNQDASCRWLRSVVVKLFGRHEG